MSLAPWPQFDAAYLVIGRGQGDELIEMLSTFIAAASGATPPGAPAGGQAM
jgi:hypothetical protein